MRASAGRARGPSMMSLLLQLLPAVAVFGMFAVVGIIHVTARVLVVDAGYTLSSLEVENRALTREQDRLKLELATLKNPARIEGLAKAQLGMGRPPPGAVITLVPQQSLTRRAASPGVGAPEPLAAVVAPRGQP